MPEHRITISIPEEMDEEIRNIQGKIIQEEGRNCTFVEVLFALVQEGLDGRQETETEGEKGL